MQLLRYVHLPRDTFSSFVRCGMGKSVQHQVRHNLDKILIFFFFFCIFQFTSIPSIGLVEHVLWNDGNISPRVYFKLHFRDAYSKFNHPWVSGCSNRPQENSTTPFVYFVDRFRDAHTFEMFLFSAGETHFEPGTEIRGGWDCSHPVYLRRFRNF